MKIQEPLCGVSEHAPRENSGMEHGQTKIHLEGKQLVFLSDQSKAERHRGVMDFWDARP